MKTSDFSTHSTALGILDQARTLVAQSRATSDDKIEWMVLLSTSYYNRGVSLYLGELPVPALPFIERSADIVKEILQGSISAEERKPELVTVLQELALQHSKRLELLAACYIKKGEKMVRRKELSDMPTVLTPFLLTGWVRNLFCVLDVATSGYD